MKLHKKCQKIDANIKDFFGLTPILERWGCSADKNNRILHPREIERRVGYAPMGKMADTKLCSYFSHRFSDFWRCINRSLLRQFYFEL